MPELDDWKPKTKLGRMVKAGEVKDIKEVFMLGLPLMESEVVDSLLPDLEEEVIDINLVQKMHRSGRRVKFRATVVVGNKDGYIGLGKATAKEVGPAIRKAITVAKMNVIAIRRGCGSWECGCGTSHSVPFMVKGKSSSVTVTLLPAPRGIGLAAGEVTKKLAKLAGITDVWSISKGQTQSTVNLTNAAFNALKNTSLMKVSDEQLKTLKIIEGKVVKDEIAE